MLKSKVDDYGHEKHRNLVSQNANDAKFQKFIFSLQSLKKCYFSILVKKPEIYDIHKHSTEHIPFYSLNHLSSAALAGNQFNLVRTSFSLRCLPGASCFVSFCYFTWRRRHSDLWPATGVTSSLLISLRCLCSNISVGLILSFSMVFLGRLVISCIACFTPFLRLDYPLPSCGLFGQS